MMNDDEKLGEKRFLDNLAAVSERMTKGFGVSEKGETSNDESTSLDLELKGKITEKNLRRFKRRKNNESQSSQQNPNHASSSSSNKPMKLWGRYYVEEPIIREPGRRRYRDPNYEPSLDLENKMAEMTKREAAVIEKEAVRREQRRPVIRERRMTPEWLVNVMREKNGVDAKLVIEKELTASDVNSNLGRLLIPFKKMEVHDMSFLNEQELNIIDEHFNKIREKGVDVMLIDPKGVRWEVNLRRWDMNSSSNYALVTGWNNVTFYNRKLLKEGHRISLWSFRSPQRLYFALPPQAQANLPPLPAPAEPPPPPPVVYELREASRQMERNRKIFVDVPRKRLRFARVRQAHAPPPPVIPEASHRDEEERDRGRPSDNFPKPMRSSGVGGPSPAPYLGGLELFALVACGLIDPSPAPSVTRDSESDEGPELLPKAP